MDIVMVTVTSANTVATGSANTVASTRTSRFIVILQSFRLQPGKVAAGSNAPGASQIGGPAYPGAARATGRERGRGHPETHSPKPSSRGTPPVF
jgi:hypothetical protein